MTIDRIKKGLKRRFVRIFEQRAHKNIERNAGLNTVLAEYLKSTGFTGCSYLDYQALCKYARVIVRHEI